MHWAEHVYCQEFWQGTFIARNRELKHQTFLIHGRQPEVLRTCSYVLRMSSRFPAHVQDARTPCLRLWQEREGFKQGGVTNGQKERENGQCSEYRVRKHF